MPEVLTESAAVRIRMQKVLTSLPYSGVMLSPPPYDQFLDTPGGTLSYLDAVAEWLEGLAAQQVRGEDQHNEERAQLEQLKSQRDAVREFLGVPL
jgi:hypothetical protein